MKLNVFPTCSHTYHFSIGSDPALEVFPSLRVLTISTDRTHVPTSRQYTIERFLRIVHAENLTALELRIPVVGGSGEVMDTLGDYNWKQLCAVICKQFPRIEELTLWFAVDGYIPQRRRTKLSAKIRKRIPSSFLGGKEIRIRWSRFLFDYSGFWKAIEHSLCVVQALMARLQECGIPTVILKKSLNQGLSWRNRPPSCDWLLSCYKRDWTQFGNIGNKHV